MVRVTPGMLCEKCGRNEATRRFVREVDGRDRVNLHLCEECARPVQARLDAKAMGQQKCEFCGGAAFTPLPAALAIVYACCGCRSAYARIFFDLSALKRPELLDRSKGDIFVFELCHDSQLEAWADEVSRDAIAELRTRLR